MNSQVLHLPRPELCAQRSVRRAGAHRRHRGAACGHGRARKPRREHVKQGSHSARPCTARCSALVAAPSVPGRSQLHRQDALSRPRPWQAEIASAGGVGAVVAGMLQHVGNTRLQARPQRRAIAFRAAVWRCAALQMLAPRRPKCRWRPRHSPLPPQALALRTLTNILPARRAEAGAVVAHWKRASDAARLSMDHNRSDATQENQIT